MECGVGEDTVDAGWGDILLAAEVGEYLFGTQRLANVVGTFKYIFMN